MKHKEITESREFIIRLERDENVLAALAAFCEQKMIRNGVFQAIGAVKESKIGYYDIEAKKYGHKEYPDEMEVASMTGNIALVDGKPFIHCHAVLSGIKEGTENHAIGGHVFEAKVAVTLEIRLTSFDGSVARILDNTIGLKLLDL